MRWFVEVASSSSQSEASEKWVVEASQWQPALQAARSLRGEAAEMSGFSIELLEDGFRAVDPTTFVRYVVRRAPDGTPISNPRSKPPPAPAQQNGGTSSAPAAPGTGEAPVTKAARIAAMLDIGAGKPSKPPAASPSAKAEPSAAKEDGSGSKKSSNKTDRASKTNETTSGPPRPAAAPRPDSPSAPPRPLSQPPPPAASTAPSVPPPAAPSQPPPPAPAGVPSASNEPLPPAELLFQREEDPSATSPLTYRETVWVVPPGTSSDAAVRLLVGMFEGVRAALAGAKPGKLVNMAIFDHRFQGKPEAPPLATLTWKDWKDQGQGPEIRRLGDPPAAQQLSAPPPTFVAPAPAVEIPPAPPVPAEGLVAAVPAPAVVAAPPPEPAAFPPPAAVPATEPAAAPLPAPVAEVPAPAPVAAAPAGPADVSTHRTPAQSSPRIRLSGVELITDLFEAMHNLHFLRDSLEGADFILALVMEKLPSTVGLVHFYDINSREFVVVRAVGPGGSNALQVRTSEKEPLIAEAMRSRRAVVIEDATSDPRMQNGRWATIGSCRSLVCAPVEQGGRFLGLLELSNPRDGGPFQETDGHALTYMGEQFAEFLATRGLVFDPERIRAGR
jgi:putative methionine-R-sulfoxide reductase with GAF domain